MEMLLLFNIIHAKSGHSVTGPVSPTVLPSHMVVRKKKEINKLQLAQNQAARLALHCSVRTNVDHIHLAWIKVDLKNSNLAF